MASGRQVEYNLRLNSNVVSVLGQADQAANKFDNSMWQVQKTLASFGIGLGSQYLIDAAKNWTNVAADYEQAMLRIKNASQEGFGIFNENYVNNQVDKFKLKLQETADAYGSFLFKIRNAHLTNDVQDRIFENLNVVGKVAAIPQEQMDATVRNLGTMLGEGVLEAKHFRQLSYVHPQIVPYLAEALGLKNNQIDSFNQILYGEDTDESAQQKLSLLISSGKLTKLAINSSVLIDAFEKYRESLEGKLPETLNTVNSELNQLSNTWERFKINLALGEKKELVNFFHDLEKSIHWLSENEEKIISTSKYIFKIAEAYTAWRIALLAMQTPSIIGGFLNKEGDRFNNSFGTSNKEKEIYLNNSLIESEIKLSESEIKLSESEIKLSESENLIVNSSVNEKNILNEKTIALDLYTEAQITNIAATEKLKDVWVQMDMFGNSAGVADASFLGFGTRPGGLGTTNMQRSSHGRHDRYRYAEEDEMLALEAQGLALRGNLALEVAYTEQAILFSKTEMDAAIGVDSLTAATEAYNIELKEKIALTEAYTIALMEEYNIVLKEKIALNADSIGTTDLQLAQLALQNGSLGAIAGTALGGAISGISKFIMPVFIAGMTADVALQFFGSKDRVSGDKLDFIDYLKDMAMILPESGKARRIDERNERFQNFENSLNNAASLLSFNNAINGSGSIGIVPLLNPKGSELFNLLSKTEFLNEIDPLDKYGKRTYSSNEELYDVLKRLIPNLPFFLDTKTSANSIPDYFNQNWQNKQKINIPNIAKPEHIRGNSSNYFSVHIDKMDGIGKLEVSSASDSQIQNIKQQIGIEINEMMLEVINDIQVVKHGH